MRTIQSSLAKTHFAQILDEVEKGETVQITRHGRVVARIVPQTPNLEQQKTGEEALADLRAFREKLPKSGTTIEEILQWRHEGHRY